MKRDLHHKLFVIITTILFFSLGMTLVLHFLLFPVRQKSISMSPSLKKGTCVLVTPLIHTPNRGDLVLLNPLFPQVEGNILSFFDMFSAFFTLQQKFPYSSSPLMSETSQIRRIVGLPGDTIYMKDYVLYVKPSGEQHYLTEFELVSSPYNIDIETSPAMWEGDLGSCKDFDPITLGQNEYFTLADNRCFSVDSRFWGTVDKSRIRGLVLLAYFPFPHFHFYH